MFAEPHPISKRSAAPAILSHSHDYTVLEYQYYLVFKQQIMTERDLYTKDHIQNNSAV
jgi:hypothetical protein